MELYKVASAYDAVCRLAGLTFPFDKALQIFRLKKEVDFWARFYSEEDLKLMKKYAVTEPDGGVVVKDGKISFANRELMDGYLTDLARLKELDIDVKPDRIDLSQCVKEGFFMTAADIGALSDFVEFGGD